MAAVYVQEFTVTVYSTDPMPREQIAKELRTMEFTGEPVISVDVGCGLMAISLQNAVERLVRDGGTRGQVKRLQEMVEAEDLVGVETEEDEITAVLADDEETEVYTCDYNGPRWTYATTEFGTIYRAPFWLVGSTRDLVGPPFHKPFVSADFRKKLSDEDVRKHSLTLIDWPGRIPDEEIEADYGFGGRKEIPGGHSPRTEDALRALIEHAVRTAPDELAGAIKTAWAVYKQRGVEDFGQGTDSLPRLCDIIVFG